MPKLIQARFRINGTPTPGLSPTINVYQVNEVGANTLLVSADPMIDEGDGWYKYVFQEVDGFDPRLDFVYDADGGVAIPNDSERFQEGACCASEPEEIADGVWEADQSLYTDINTMGGRHNATFSNTEQLLLDVNDVFNLVDLVRKYDTNRTRVDPNAFTLTVFDDDGVTPLRVFDLKDANGNASVDPVCERDPQ